MKEKDSMIKDDNSKKVNALDKGQYLQSQTRLSPRRHKRRAKPTTPEDSNHPRQSETERNLCFQFRARGQALYSTVWR